MKRPSDGKESNRIILDKLVARGHPNVLSTHQSTLEFTKEDFLTLNGDCILGINANTSVNDYSRELKSEIHSFKGFGSPKLALDNDVSMVFRKSNYICGRTALIKCDKCANDIDREIVELMKNPENEIVIRFYKANESN